MVATPAPRSATPRIARLLLSVAPLVKTISRSLARIAAAISARALLDRLLRFVSKTMAGAARIAVDFAPIGPHRLDHAGIDPRRGVIVHVDG